MTTDEGFKRWARAYGAEPNPLRALADRLLQSWIERVRPGERLLDAGCGPEPAAGAFGLDLSRGMLAAAPRGRVVQADIAAPPFAPGTFDWVWTSLALSYAADPPAALRSLAALARPGGRLMVCDLHPAAAGWTRGPGIESRVGSLDPGPGWAALERREAPFGRPERAVFEAAGRLDLWERTRGTPALLAVLWSLQTATGAP